MQSPTAGCFGFFCSENQHYRKKPVVTFRNLFVAVEAHRRMATFSHGAGRRVKARNGPPPRPTAGYADARAGALTILHFKVALNDASESKIAPMVRLCPGRGLAGARQGHDADGGNSPEAPRRQHAALDDQPPVEDVISGK